MALPTLPHREAEAAQLLRELGFPVKGHAVFHTEHERGMQLHVAVRRARESGVLAPASETPPFESGQPQSMTEAGRELLAWFQAGRMREV